MRQIRSILFRLKKNFFAATLSFLSWVRLTCQRFSQEMKRLLQEIIQRSTGILCQVPGVHPMTFYTLYICFVIALFLGWLYFEHDWNFTWLQISMWLKNHIASVVIVFVVPFIIIPLLHRFICSRLSLRGVQFLKAKEYSSLFQFVFVTITLIAVCSLGIRLYVESIQLAVASHGCVDAVSITANTTWSTNQCHGDVTVTNGAILTINGGITANLSSLTLGDTVPTNGFIVAKGDTVNNVGVVINLDGNFEVKSGSNISANGQGYTTDYSGPGAGSLSPSTAAGHGGQGGTADLNTITGGVYGSVTAPTTLGSSAQGDGGGAIKLSIGGNAIVNGPISANATDVCCGSRASAGGSVWFDFTGGSSTLSGNGTIAANGDGSNGAGGGGGRVAITGYTTNSHSGTISAYGGSDSLSAGRDGAPGTVYLKSTAETNGTLISDYGGGTISPQEGRYTGTGILTLDTLTIRNRGVITFVTGNTVTATTTTIATNGQLHPHIAHNIGGSITVQSTGKISHAANTTAETYKIAGLTVTNLTIDSGGSVDVAAKGYTTNFSGPGAGSGTDFSGAGHGGQGGTTNTAASSGATYGSTTQPTTIGSSSESDGGGAIHLTISGNLTNNGTINANGQDTCCGDDAGAGGSVLIEFTGSGTLSGTGSISANGGATNARTGGGGRIAITGHTSITMSGTIGAYGGSGSASAGAPGTVYLKSTSETNGTLISDNNNVDPQDNRITGTGNITVDTLTIRNRGEITFRTSNIVTATNTTISANGQLLPEVATTLGTVTIQNTGKITHTPNTNAETYKISNLTLSTLTIDSGGSVNVEGKGYTDNYAGPGAGNSSTGAGHGGQGGAFDTATTAGVTYGSTTQPTTIGSSSDSDGGGAIHLTITGSLTNNGTIQANGVNTGSGANPGAGGSIWIEFTGVSGLSGSGSISANGGNTNTETAGGGRVSITGYTTNSMSGVISAYGGATGSALGAAGTVYTKSTSETNGTLISDNNSIDPQNTRITGTGNVTVDTLTIRNRGEITFRTNNIVSATNTTISANGQLLPEVAATLGTVTVQNTGSITHTTNTNAETYKITNFTANNLTIDSGGSVNVEGKGYTTDYSGPGAGAASPAVGAGHGGQGGTNDNTTTAGGTYGSVTQPTTIGSSSDTEGGGAIHLTITGNLTNNGTVNANGVSLGSGGRGGAGGSVWIEFTGVSSTLSGSGSIAANGGLRNGQTGGGGRVSVTGYVTNSMSGVISAYGGNPNGFADAGAPGTVYTKGANDANGTLKIDNNSITHDVDRYTEVGTTVPASTLLIQNSAQYFSVSNGGNLTIINSSLTAPAGLRNRGTFTYSNSLTIPNGSKFIVDVPTTIGGDITVQSGGKITHTANTTAETYKINLSANSLTINSGGTVDASSLGYTGGAADAAGNGPGAGALGGLNSGGGGGGHGGTGVTGQGANGGAGGGTYGSSTAPVTIGSGGGGGDTSAGGIGGGAIKLNMTNAITVSGTGTITANGGNGVSSNYGGGGGSGGSIYLLASTITCPANSVTSNGGNGAGTIASGGGGAGGRIALAIGSTYSCVPVVTNGSFYEAPAAPTNLTANGTSSTVVLTWIDNSTTETEFRIQDNAHTLLRTKISTTTATTGTQYSIEITGLTPNTNYSYHVHAIDSVEGESFGSNTVNLLTLAAFPGSVTLSNHTNGSLKLTFSPTSNPANVEYTIRELITGKYVQDNGTLADTVVWQTYANWGDTGGITITGLTKATLYTFGVKARNSGLVETTYISNSSVDPNTPVAPALFDPASTEIGVAIEVDGNPSVVEYAIYESTTNQYISYVDSLSGFATMGGTNPLWKTYIGWGDYFGITLRGLTPLTTYKFSVKARYPGGTETGFGPESEITTNTDAVSTGGSGSSGETGGLGGVTGTATTAPSSGSSSGGSSGGTTQEEEFVSGGGETEVVFAERKRRTFFDYWNDVWYQQQYDWWDSNSMFSGSGWFGSTVGGSIGWGLLPWGMGRSQGGFSRSTIYRSQGGFGTGGGCGFSCIGGGFSGGFGGGGGGTGSGGAGGGGGSAAFSGMSSALQTMMRLGGGIPRGLNGGLPQALVELTSSTFGGLASGTSGTDRFDSPQASSSWWDLYKQFTQGDYTSLFKELFDGPGGGFEEGGGEDSSTFLERLFASTGIPDLLTSIFDIVVVGLFVQEYTGLLIAGYYAGFTPSQTNLIFGAAAILSLVIPLIQALSATLIPLINTIGATLPDKWVNVLSWRKRRKKWGRIISALTYKEIPDARVALYNVAAYNRLVEQTVTGKDGRFGFLAREGDYTIVVSHPKYKFPATLASGGYHGQPLRIKGEEVIKMDIPVDPVKVENRFRLPGETIRLTLLLSRRPLLFLGTALSIYNLTRSVSIVNVLFIVYYVILWIFELRHKKDVHNTITVTDGYNRPLPFAIVRLTNDKGEVVLAKATTETGKVFVLVPAGQYTLEIVPPANAPFHTPLKQALDFQGGGFDKPLTFRLQ